ncbi:uracil-DNA glycosylase [Rhodoferax ferrireducens]|uniref:uracil-DNA glycosylase n=1 Tax=Rhodoferax ferrireducens TaxID=192843 RepID=UPI000E0D1C6B|nr:uracil-DNA glycosylase [Rhodoferax ferrireducens]
MSLDLDTRQRAILQEMGVRVWLPQAVADEPAVLDAPQSVAQTSRPVIEVPPPAVQVRSAAAIEEIAVSALSTGAAGQKYLKTQGVGRAAAAPSDATDTRASTGLADGIAAMDWATLTDAVHSCQACQLCIGRRAPVFGAAEAPAQADWLVVGEPPEEAEERLGAPFADQTGQLLDNMLKAVGVSRRGPDDAASVLSAAQAAYVTNVVKCRPAVVRNPSALELAICENYLRREVALVRPKVILAMGRFAAQTLLHGSLAEGSKIPFGKLRGQIYRYQGIPVVVTYHPTYLLRTPQDKARAWADLCLALDVIRQAG